MFKAALAPVLSQLKSLNENVSLVLLDGHDDSDEDGETVSNDGSAKSADVDADLSALLASAGKDDNDKTMTGEGLLKELAQVLTVSDKTSSPLREGLAAIFNNLFFFRKGGGREAQGQTGQQLSSRECPGFANPENESFNLEPAFDYHESSRCKIAEGAKHFYRRYHSHDQSRLFGAGKIQGTDHLVHRCCCNGFLIKPRGESLSTPGHEERDS